ncbi:serine--tRNA ligase, mitochondrial-like [Liolophura sinensis]|uniref:serine--tRNA ligase, mitochondrial-like n=1 Tax=Liolophura sinensis TaxID=3198878 RepID=UPI00315914FE
MAAFKPLQKALDAKLRKIVLVKCCQVHRLWTVRLRSTRTQSSALFISNAVAQHTSPVQVDLDLEKRLIHEFDVLRDNIHRRGNTIDLQKLVEDFKQLKMLDSRKTTLEEQRDSIAGMMKTLVKAQVKSDDVQRSKEVLISRGKEVRETLKALMPQYLELEERVMLTALRLPNQLHPDTVLCVSSKSYPPLNAYSNC